MFSFTEQNIDNFSVPGPIVDIMQIHQSKLKELEQETVSGHVVVPRCFRAVRDVIQNLLVYHSGSPILQEGHHQYFQAVQVIRKVRLGET